LDGKEETSALLFIFDTTITGALSFNTSSTGALFLAEFAARKKKGSAKIVFFICCDSPICF
jgi:hypothetical protein